MKDCSRTETIMLTHHQEALLERCPMVFNAQSTSKIVDDNCVDISQWQVLLSCRFHHSDAPVDVGREFEMQVVEVLFGDVCAGIKGLMTHQHATAERTPCELFGRREPTVAKEMAIVVDDIGVAIENTGERFALSNAAGNMLKGVG